MLEDTNSLDGAHIQHMLADFRTVPCQKYSATFNVAVNFSPFSQILEMFLRYVWTNETIFIEITQEQWILMEY